MSQAAAVAPGAPTTSRPGNHEVLRRRGTRADNRGVTPAELKLAARAQTDEELAVLAGRGDAPAFATIVDRHSPALLAFARNTVGPELAEDVLQQSLMQAWSALRGGAEVGHVRGWLFQIVRRASWAASQGRVCSELPMTLASSDDVHASIEQRLQLRRVVEQVGNLPSNQRLALVQTAVEGRSRAEVAATLGVTEGAVRQLLHRGRERIRQAAAGFIPAPLWKLLVRSAHPEAIAGSGRETAAAFALFGAGTKAVIAALSVGALAAGTGAEIHHLRQDARSHRAAALQADSGSPAPRLLSELFAAPGGRAAHPGDVGGFTGTGPAAGMLPITLPGAVFTGIGGQQLPDGQWTPSASSPNGETAATGGAGPAQAGARPVMDPSAGAGSDGAPAGSSVDHQPGHGADPGADATPGTSAGDAAGDHAAPAPSGADPAPAGTGSDPATAPAADSAAPPAADTAPTTTPDPSSADDPAPVGFELTAPPASGG